MFGHVELRRNYYLDRESGKYVNLLDRYLDFDGGQMMSPAVQDLAIELAVTGVSYRQASDALEKLLGYPVISHEGIRQQVLQIDVVPKEKQSVAGDVIFVEVDGLYTRSQEKGRKGREFKISAVHHGWEMNGERVKFIVKQHFIHEGFLMASYDYVPTHHHLVINETTFNKLCSRYNPKQYSLFTTVYIQACCSRLKRIKGLLLSIKSISSRYTRRLQRVG